MGGVLSIPIVRRIFFIMVIVTTSMRWDGGLIGVRLSKEWDNIYGFIENEPVGSWDYLGWKD